jgi:cysteine desulfurase
VLDASAYLRQRTNVGVAMLPVDRSGRLCVRDLRRALDGNPCALVALMAANNQIGTRHPIREIAAVAHAAGATFLCDTTQAFGRIPIDLAADGIDFATVSGHKIYGPKGCGALFVRRALVDSLEPLIVGGGQDVLRGGTQNAPAIAALGEACRLVVEDLDADVLRMSALRDRLEFGILERLAEVWVNGDTDDRLCNTTNIGFKRVDARTLIRDMHDIACSTRSACSSGNSGPSHVLKAIGLSDEDAYSCIRFSLGRFTTEEEIDYTINKVVTSVHKLRRNKSVRI